MAPLRAAAGPILAFGACLLGVLPAAASPPPGRYAGELCVATRPDQAASCGPAEIDLQRRGRAEVRLADIVYRLQLRTSQLDVTTLQGRTRIDAFDAPYDWAGSVLRFEDAAKGVRYEIRLGPRRRAGR